MGSPVGARDSIGRYATLAICISTLAVASYWVLGDDLQNFTVTATRPQRSTGEQLTLTWTVAHDGLDLRQRSDIAEFKNRIATRAKAVCDALDRLAPVSPSADPDCPRKAAEPALAQADRLIAIVATQGD